jgi:hypothetical protein
VITGIYQEKYHIISNPKFSGTARFLQTFVPAVERPTARENESTAQPLPRFREMKKKKTKYKRQQQPGSFNLARVK